MHAGLDFGLWDGVMHWEPSSPSECASGVRDVRLRWLWFFVAILIPLLILEFPSPTRHTTKIAKVIVWIRISFFVFIFETAKLVFCSTHIHLPHFHSFNDGSQAILDNQKKKQAPGPGSSSYSNSLSRSTKFSWILRRIHVKETRCG